MADRRPVARRRKPNIPDETEGFDRVGGGSALEGAVDGLEGALNGLAVADGLLWVVVDAADDTAQLRCKRNGVKMHSHPWARPANGTIGVSVGAAVPLAYRSKRFWRRMRYS